MIKPTATHPGTTRRQFGDHRKSRGSLSLPDVGESLLVVGRWWYTCGRPVRRPCLRSTIIGPGGRIPIRSVDAGVRVRFTNSAGAENNSPTAGAAWGSTPVRLWMDFPQSAGNDPAWPRHPWPIRPLTYRRHCTESSRRPQSDQRSGECDLGHPSAREKSGRAPAPLVDPDAT